MFEDFTSICKEYTATGKGIIGMQEAMAGNLKHAVELWKESGILGNAKSSFNLGLCYETGKGVQKNIGEVKLLTFYSLIIFVPCTRFII